MKVSKNKKFIYKFIILNLIGSLFPINISYAESRKFLEQKEITINTSYLKREDIYKDYILDSGDEIKIEFIKTPELDGEFIVDEKGEILIPELKNTYVSGLTINELKILLEERYKEFLIAPEIDILLITFKPIKVAIRGEIQNQGIYKFDYSLKDQDNKEEKKEEKKEEIRFGDEIFQKVEIETKQNNFLKSAYPITLSKAIQRAGGLTPYSDLTKVEIVRKIPISKGAGMKKAIIDASTLLTNQNNSFKFLLLDGDNIFIPKLKEKNNNLVTLSINYGLTPKYINVKVSGDVPNPGEITIPTLGTLSDALYLAGGKNPLSGRILLMRYDKNGSLIRQKINFKNRYQNGSKNNPSLMDGDYIVVKKSNYKKTAETINAITAPATGIYSTIRLFGL